MKIKRIGRYKFFVLGSLIALLNIDKLVFHPVKLLISKVI